jgi:hypothetical protein
MPPAENGGSNAKLNDSAPENYSPYERWVRTIYLTNINHPVKLGLENIEQLHEAGRP